VEIPLHKKLIQPSRSAYRALNQQTQKHKYPLPRIEDLLDRLTGASVFSSLDLQFVYQIHIAEEDVPQTAFKMPQELFEFRVLDFGLNIAPAAFQREMNRSLGHSGFVLVYLDDILVFSKDEKHLRQVLKLLESEQLYAKMSMCSFLQQSLHFLGHVVSAAGIHVDPRKSATTADWPRPRDVSEVHSFLGLDNYFKRFI